MSEARQLFMEVSLAAQKQSFSEVEALNTFRGPQGPRGEPGGIDNLVINGKEAVPVDGKNTINLTAADVYALPSGGTAVNANALNGKSADEYILKTDTAADSAKLGGKAPEYYLQPRNLLDNSWWEVLKEIVNQRGQTSFTGASGINTGYIAIDRWLFYGTGTTFNIADGGIEAVNDGSATCGSAQRLTSGIIEVGKTYTLACKAKVTGTCYLSYGISSTANTASSDALETETDTVHVFTFTAGTSTDGQYNFRIRSTAEAATIKVGWMALYEGEYTANNLPPYVPKGYAAELAECQRYYYQIKAYWKWLASGICTSATQACITMKLPTTMRVSPSIIIPQTELIRVKCGSVNSQVPSAIECVNASVAKDIIQLNCTVSGATVGDVAMLYFDNAGVLEISADL